MSENKYVMSIERPECRICQENLELLFKFIREKADFRVKFIFTEGSIHINVFPE